jgi:hypothetical protein
MTATTTSEALDAIVAGFAADPTISSATRTVARHGGKVTEKEMLRYSKHAPALLVTWLGTKELTQQGGETRMCGEWLAFIVTKRKDRHIDAQDLHDRVMKMFAQGEDFSGTFEYPPDDESSTNIYSSEFDAAGLEVVLIRWKQIYKLADAVDVDALPDFNFLDSCYWPDGTMPDVEDPLGFPDPRECLASDVLELNP